MTLVGPELRAGAPAPQFSLTASDLSLVNLDMLLDRGQTGGVPDHRAVARYKRLLDANRRSSTRASGSFRRAYGLLWSVWICRLRRRAGAARKAT